MAASPAAGGWAQAPYQLLDAASAPGGKGRLLVYLLVHRHGHGSPHGCWASATTLAREAAMKRDDVFSALRWLVAHGWLIREQRPGQPSLYRCRRTPVPPLGDTPEMGDGSHPPDGGHPKQGAPPKKGTPPIPQSVTPPTPHLGDTNKNPGTRTPEQEPGPASRSLSTCCLSAPEALGPQTAGKASAEPPREAPGVAQPPAAIEEPWPEPCWGPPPPPPLPPPAVAPHLPVPVEALPLPLQCIADRIEAYWLGKGGNRSQQAFAVMLEELSAVALRAGHQSAAQFLRQATQAGWPTLNAETWLAQHRQELALERHPAYQVFRAA